MTIRKTGAAQDPEVEVEGGISLSKTAAGQGWTTEDEAALKEETDQNDEL